MTGGFMTGAPLKRFVCVGDQMVHYRVTGTGPAIVMLHDSPRSSRLHIEAMQALAECFTVFALDTPGYGNSTPLTVPNPTIRDFADALGETLAALGLLNAPLYATHTSAKIALEYVADCAEPPVLLLLDGLSIPVKLADEAFLEAYMRPFVIDDAGAYLAAEWTRLRDMLRWFPWFDTRPETRMPNEPPTDAWVELYALDLLSAGPHYSDAYAAAMRYDTLPALRRVGSPTVVAARANDVLYSSLDRVPEDCSACVTVERLSSDHAEWLGWVGDTLAAACGSVVSDDFAPAVGADGPVYVDLPHGQMLVHRDGAGGGKPLLILETPTILHARIWQEALSGDRVVLVPELPGYGESDAIEGATIADYADAVAAMLRMLDAGPVDVLAIGLAGPLAMALAARDPDLVGSLVLDGVAGVGAAPERLCPAFEADYAGGHWHQIWHMLRDGEVQWPWFDGSVAAQRRLAPCLDGDGLHRALLDVLKQPDCYGDVALAGLRGGAVEVSDTPVTLFDMPGDAGYAWVGDLAAGLPLAKVLARPAGVADAAVLLRAVLG